MNVNLLSKFDAGAIETERKSRKQQEFKKSLKICNFQQKL